ncbi:MarR family winged helix-turn-helix transcriptional regulator [Rouxiella badensis]|nr:MarR family winged helix-turn-helix transcriptional regulator [Rouxiella badensis]MCC3735732.1 MarR family winged helix-turn-helix transcriptional regulator [Rouxiella badensis]MCC3742689.1 MarR family winged helix-turn-helix transcriptional regulator [Rouxiella badensis]
MYVKTNIDLLKIIGHAARAAVRTSDAPLRELGFTMSQLPVLIHLSESGQNSQAELVAVLGVEQPSVSQLLNRMERDGLIDRVPDPADGRVRLVRLTSLARLQLPKGRFVLDDVAKQASKGLGEDEKRQLVSLLSRVSYNLGSPFPGS